MPPCPLVIALVPLKCSSRNLKFPHMVSSTTKEKKPWCPCPFKTLSSAGPSSSIWPRQGITEAMPFCVSQGMSYDHRRRVVVHVHGTVNPQKVPPISKTETFFFVFSPSDFLASTVINFAFLRVLGVNNQNKLNEID